MLTSFKKQQKAPSAETVTNRLLDLELTKLFFQQIQEATLAGIVGSSCLALIITCQRFAPSVLLWLGLVYMIYIVRFCWIRTLMRREIDACNDRVNLGIIYLCTATLGIAWGLAAWLFMWPDENVTQLPFLLGLVGILTLSAPMMSARPKAGILFITPLLVGMTLRLHKEVEYVFASTTAMICVLAAFTVLLTYRHHRTIRKSISLRLEKETLFDKLIDAKIRAEETANAKSSFLATMSHEIRTPINGLMGMLEILKDSKLDSMQANYLNTASRSAESLLRLLNDILDYSKIEVGKLELERVPFDWIAMLGEIAMMNRVLALDKGLAFHLDIPAEGTSIVVGDPTRLRQILNNLLSNALKFTHEGNIWLKVTIDNETADKVMLSISVKDSGIGIDAEAQQRLFQNYQQASASTSRRYGGSGLGLAISQQLAHLMGGNIRIVSEPGRGSEFILTAPFPKASADSLYNYVSGSSGSSERFRAKALVVEDDPVSQRVVVLMLKSFGITPTVVNGGKAAVETSEREHFDIIFMDLHLPDMDGFEASGIISTRKPSEATNAGRRQPTIVAMTGADTAENRQRAQESGISDFIPKPVRKRDMRLCLERWVGKSAAVYKPESAQDAKQPAQDK